MALDELEDEFEDEFDINLLSFADSYWQRYENWDY
jgi:hypothetical protein